tara:strand:- start:3554 stop:3793 length:240 start_codon:yes stop_codon:yes gene_type:complete
VNIDDLLVALREVVTPDHEHDGWFTRQEFQDSTNVSEKRAIQLLKAGVSEGIIEVGRVYRHNIAGVSTKIIAYRKRQDG